MTAGELVVGVTGHRALADPAGAAEAIDAELARLAAEAPSATVVVLTSLAEGADRLVARRALARPGTRLRALLPLAAAAYEADFATAGSVAEFRELLARAESVEVVAGDGGAPGGEGDDRERAHLAARRAVADRCDVLLALWDGRPARGPAGAAEIVGHARRWRRPVVVVEVERAPDDESPPA